MRRFAAGMSILVGVLAILSAIVSVSACPSPVPPATAAEAQYTAALLRCVDASKTLAESKACRAKQDEFYGVHLDVKDGGK